ncbi:MAG: hypothetical protein IT260_01495 [Saprospiraceae bacterium]|nr:hypothetical protein [Saprospiraceae bacterium]
MKNRVPVPAKKLPLDVESHAASPEETWPTRQAPPFVLTTLPATQPTRIQASTDNEMFDSSRHAAAMWGPPTVEAAKSARSFQSALETEEQQTRKAYLALENQSDQYKGLIEAEKNPLEIVLLKQEKEAIDQKLKQATIVWQQVSADSKALRDPATDSTTFHQILARRRAFVQTKDSSPQFFTDQKDFESRTSKALPNGGQRMTTTTSQYNGNTGMAESQQDIRALEKDGLGVKLSFNEASERVSAESKQSAATEKTARLGDGGLELKHLEKASTTGIDGKTASQEQKSSFKVSASDITFSATGSQTEKDGSGLSGGIVNGVERKDGKIGWATTKTASEKTADGGQNTFSSTAKKGISSGKDGTGAYQSKDFTGEHKWNNGLKASGTFGQSSNILFNIQQVPNASPPAYKVSISVSFSGRIGASTGYEKEGKSLSGGASLSAEGSVGMSWSLTLPENNAKKYLALLEEASKGGMGDGSDKMRIIQTGAKEGWEKARQMYQGASGGISSKAALDALPEGGTLGTNQDFKTNISLTAGSKPPEGFAASLDLGQENQNASARTVTKKNGQFEFETIEAESTKYTGGLNGSIALVSGGFKVSSSDTTSTGYKIILNPNDPEFETLRAEYAKCASQKDLDQFAEKHPKTVQEKTKTSGNEKTFGSTLGIVGLEMGLNLGTGTETSVTTDGSGTVTERQKSGSNMGGLDLKFGDYKLTSSEKESATARVNYKTGETSLDVNQAETETDSVKWLEANIPGLKTTRSPGDPGLLSQLTGGAKQMADTERKDVSGMYLQDKDIEYLAELARNAHDWMSHCPSPRLRGDWAATRQKVVQAQKNKGLIASALADFVGHFGHDRDEVIYRAASGGARYEFPGALLKLKGLYIDKVIKSPIPAIDEIGQKDGVEKAKTAAVESIAQLESLYRSVKSVPIGSASDQFSKADVQAEMMSAIARRKLELQDKLRVLNGGKPGEISRQERQEKFDALLENCIQYQQKEFQLFAEIEKNHEAFYWRQLNRLTDNVALLGQIRKLYPVWEKDYADMATLAKEYNFGTDRYWKYKPDTVRFTRTENGGRPGQASEAGPDPAIQQKKQKAAALMQWNKGDEANTLHAIGQVAASRQKAMMDAKRLNAWLKYEKKSTPAAAYHYGMQRLSDAHQYAAEIPKNKVDQETQSYSGSAMTSYLAAIACFKDGLAQYPAGWPPKA